MLIKNQPLDTIADTTVYALAIGDSLLYLEDNQGIIEHPRTVVILEETEAGVGVVRWVRNVTKVYRKIDNPI